MTLLIRYLFLLFLLFHSFLLKINARCPNGCSGNGHCSLNNKCICNKEWDGGAPDCSKRKCPYGVAWFDKAYGTDLAHVSTECSNNGICDRRTGSCKCFDGFQGESCNLNTCNNDCSGHGICSTIADISYYNGQGDPDTFGGAVYSNWDKDSLSMCECEDGYFGPDCSLKMCPKGDDPDTINQQYRKININIMTYTPLFLTGRVGIQLYGDVAYISLTNPVNCNSTLSYSGPFGEVYCSYVRYSDRGGSIYFTLTFISWPTIPTGNNLYSHYGNPSISDFSCDLSEATKLSTCEFTDATTVDIIEYDYCSNRGSCDFTSGVCTCFDGYSGTACSNQTNYNNGYGSNSLPGMLVNVNGNNFVSDVVMLTSDKAKAPDFFFLQCKASDEEVFSVRGDGTVKMNSLKILSDGIDVHSGGVMVTSGGLTTVSDGINVHQISHSSPVLSVTSQNQLFLPSTFSALSVAGLSPSSVFSLMSASNNGSTKFSIRSDGQVGIHRSGLSFSVGLTINSGGIALNSGLLVKSNGIIISSGGFRSTGGLTVSDVGMKLYQTGGKLYDGGVTISTSGLKVHGGGLSIASGGLVISPTRGGLSINFGGLRVYDGVTVLSMGVFVSTSGLTVAGDGLVIDQLLQPVQLLSDGATITGGVTITTGGLYLSTSGVTVQSDGILSNSMSVNSLGMRVSTGMTVNSLGLKVSGGMSIFSNGASVKSMEVANIGLYVTGGLTTTTTVDVQQGLRVSGGVTFYTNVDALGKVAATYLSIHDGGLFVTGGMTVISNIAGAGFQAAYAPSGINNPKFQSTPTVFSDRRLKYNILSIENALSKVKRLQGVYYNWIQNEPSGLTFDTDRHVGVMAQEVLSVLPEAVDQSSHSKYLGVNYNNLVPLLIEAIRELKDNLFTQEIEKKTKNELIIPTNNLKQCDYSFFVNKTIEVRNSLQEEIQINNKLTREVKALQMKLSYLRLNM